MAFCVCVCNKLVQFSPGSLHSCCEASQVLNIHDAKTCFSDDFSLWALSIFVIFPFVLTWLAFNDNSSLFLINYWIMMIFFEFLPCCGLIFWFGSMLDVVYKHKRAARILAKQLRFNGRFLFKSGEKSAVKLMAIVIGLFIIVVIIALQCFLVSILKGKKSCNDEEFKTPLLVLNSAINPVAYALFKRDIKEEVKRSIRCVI